MKRLLIFTCLGVVLFSAPAFAKPKKKQEQKGPVISRITVRSTDIFDFETKPYLQKFPYTWMNILHIQTKQDVIERELLFKVGDRVDEFLLDETERNLRALSFIQSARIAQFPQRDGSVVIVVYVSDAWTTEPQMNVGGHNRVDTLEVGLREKNLLGLGKRLDFLYGDSPERIERTYRYSDPRLLGSRWQLNGEVVSQTDGLSRELAVAHPFYAADTPWAARAFHNHTEQEVGEFVNNVQVSEFKQTKETHQVGGALKVGPGRRIVNHVGLRYVNEDTHFSPTVDTKRPIPVAQDFQTVFLDIETLRNKYIKIDRVEKMTRVEDFNLGPTFSVSPGYSPRSLTGRKDTDQFSTFYEQRWLTNKTNLYYMKYTYSSRNLFEDTFNTENEFSFRYYHREWPIQTLLLHTRAQWGHRLDPDNQMILGGDNGLRAYEVDQFVGNRSWLLNVEDRFYFVDDFLNLFSIGAAAFYDVGAVWEQGQAVSLSDLNNSVGAGLRIGLTKSSNEVIVRFDVSYRLETVSTDSDRIVITFGTGQAF